MRILGIVPARAGSKRLPGKNVRALEGRPLIQWTIDAARTSGCLAHVVVSSDDPKVLRMAGKRGVQGIERPARLATDGAGTTDVVAHAMDACAGIVDDLDAVMLLQPTSPLRTAEDIRGAVRLFLDRSAASVVSVCRTDHPPQWTTAIGADGSLSAFYASLKSLPHRSQDLPPYYRLNGAIYLVGARQFRLHRTLFCEPGYAYVMPAERSVDIDTELDFVTCEALLRSRAKS
jgi:CMP-N,N'-diacetyllegionaminic acid synthase